MDSSAKGGDKGTTSLTYTKNLSKSDDRVQLIGALDELTSHLGLLKTMIKDGDIVGRLESVQEVLSTLMSGVSDPYSKDYRIHDEQTEILEADIGEMKKMFRSPEGPVFPGANRLSAQIDIARSVARRAERALASVSVKFGADNGAKKYMNRLADYLYVLARYMDTREGGAFSSGETVNVSAAAGRAVPMNENANGSVNAAVVEEVLKKMGVQGRITLDEAKRLIDIIEDEAKRRGKKAVIAVCGPDGNPIAVHAMDGALFLSFEVAIKKAYTAVAVQMSTMELHDLVQPGGTFCGLDNMDGSRIVTFGGGVPVRIGDMIIGGLGVSGGNGEEDHDLAEFGLAHLTKS